MITIFSDIQLVDPQQVKNTCTKCAVIVHSNFIDHVRKIAKSEMEAITFRIVCSCYVSLRRFKKKDNFRVGVTPYL